MMLGKIFSRNFTWYSYFQSGLFSIKLFCSLPVWFILFFLAGCESTKHSIELNLPKQSHGLNFTDPVKVWDEALPLGNGHLGGLVWGEGHPLKISLDCNTLWDTRIVPEYHSKEYSYKLMRQWHDEGRTKDLIRIYEAPYSRPNAPTKIPAGRIELSFADNCTFSSTSLNLLDALAETRFSENATARVMVHAVQQVGMIVIKNPSSIVPKLKAPPFSGTVTEKRMDAATASQNLAYLGYPAPEQSSGDNFQAFTQKGSDGFHFAVYFGWKKIDGEWLGAWSIATSKESDDPLNLATERAEKALATGFDTMLESHREWWKNYWTKSTIAVPNPIIERQWFLEQYKFGSASRRGHPPITLQGVWTADNEQIPPWKGDYHHDLNTQLSYWPCYSANHLEEGLSFLDWLWDTRNNCIEWTRMFFDLPGMCVPMTADINNNQMGGWRQYTHSSTTTAWLAHHFYLHWKYSADRNFLKERAYPYLRDASVFIEALTAKKGADGFRTIPLSASPEINDNRPDAWFKIWTNFDLALVRWLLGATAELADEQSLAEDAQHWRQVLSEMPGFSFSKEGELLVARDYPLKESHRHFSHLMAIHPLGLIDLMDGADAQKTISATLAGLDNLGTSRWCGYSFSWLGNVAARARDGKKAEQALETFATAFTLRNSFHCNGDQSGKGYSKFTYRPFTLEGNFAEAAGIQEMLMQSHRGKILLFPAIPENWKNVSFTTLRAQGAFLVSAERTDGKTRQVEIISEMGGTCTLISPFSGKEIILKMQPGEKIVLTKDPV